MIIYQNTINGFINDCQLCELLVGKIITEMKNKLGYSVSESEKNSWKTTLRNTSKYFNEIDEKNNQYILLEFKIPKSKKRINIIVVGKNKDKNNLLIIKLKGWSKVEINENSNLLKINTKYRESLHPAFEAHNYKKILEDQFSEINTDFSLHASAFLPNFEHNGNNPLEDDKYSEIIKKVKTYTKSSETEFVSYLKTLFSESIDINYVNKLSNLEYKPSKTFLKHAENQFQNIQLIGSQMFAFEKIKFILDSFTKTNKKTLITISGAAGSGKTIVAFKVLGYIISTLQKDAKLMLPGPEFRQAVKKQFDKNTLLEFIGGADINTEHNYLVIDEAHKATGQGTAGAFYNIIFQKANFIIALIDDMQVINKKGISKKQIQDLAEKHNFSTVNIDLQEHFRNAGDSTYVEWLKNWIHSNENGQNEFVQNFFEFNVLDEKEFNLKYKDFYYEYNVRMLSFWTQTWDLKELDDNLPRRNIKIGNSYYAWNPNWQWLKEFKRNSPDTKITKELLNLCQNQNFNSDKKGHQYIGYFNTV